MKLYRLNKLFILLPYALNSHDIRLIIFNVIGNVLDYYCMDKICFLWVKSSYYKSPELYSFAGYIDSRLGIWLVVVTAACTVTRRHLWEIT